MTGQNMISKKYCRGIEQVREAGWPPGNTPTVSQLKDVSLNHRPQRAQISTVSNAPFRLKLESNGPQVDSNRKFSERIFSTPAIFKATSKLFGLLSSSNDKNRIILSDIRHFPQDLQILQFNSAFTVCFQPTRSYARVKFNNGVIFLDQSQSNCWLRKATNEIASFW